MVFINTHATDPGGITSFYQKAHCLQLDKTMTENRAAMQLSNVPTLNEI